MARTYELNTQAAKDANSGGKRITEPGVYTGSIKAAWYDKNDRGTESVTVMFESDAGQSALLPLYTHNSNGDPLPSFKTLNALMVCARVKKLEAKAGKVMLYDFDAREDREESKQVFADLAGKKLGLVLQAEEYTNSNGEPRTRMDIGAPFEAATRLMAGEILDRSTTPVALDRYLVWFEKNKVKASRGRSAPAQRQAATAPVDDFSDDIPF